MELTTVLLGSLLSAFAAGVPAAGWSALVWWCDRYEREPLALGVGGFVWGALPAIVISLAAESMLGVPTALFGSALAQDVFASSGLTPAVEELAKGIGLVLILLGWRVEFDNLLDGLLYGALVGFGFGVTENVLYYMAALLDGGWGSWGVAVVVRGVVFGLNHAFFTAFTGAGIGMARSATRGWVRRWAPWIGLGLAILFHSLHNLGASLSAVASSAILLSFFSGATGVALVAVMIGLALRQEARWLRIELADEVGRLLTDAEYRSLLSMRGRRDMVAKARFLGGRRAARSVRRFQELATELAFRKQRLRHREGDQALLAVVSGLKLRLAEARAVVIAGQISPDRPQSG